MTAPAQRQGVNKGLLIALIVAGVLLIVFGWRGCFWPGVGVRLGDHWTSIGFFWSPLYRLIGIWGLINLALALWVGFHASRRGLSGPLWGLLTFFTGVVGLIVYLIVAPTMESQRAATARSSSAVAPPAGAPSERCRNCGSEIRPDFKVCPDCGTPVQSTCRECGKPLRLGWKVCPYCGTSVGEAPKQGS